MRHELNHTDIPLLSRRSFFEHAATGLQGAALLHLLSRDLRSDESREAPNLLPRKPHLPAKAKSVIHLFMNGGPSQMDLFDPKPMLDKMHGQSYFDKIAAEVEFNK